MKKWQNNNHKSQSERKRAILGLLGGSALILFTSICGLYFIPKAYAAQSIINRKGAQVMEYMDITIFCLTTIAAGAVILVLNIKRIIVSQRNNRTEH